MFSRGRLSPASLAIVPGGTPSGLALSTERTDALWGVVAVDDATDEAGAGDAPELARVTAGGRVVPPHLDRLGLETAHPLHEEPPVVVRVEEADDVPLLDDRRAKDEETVALGEAGEHRRTGDDNPCRQPTDERGGEEDEDEGAEHGPCARSLADGSHVG